MRIKSSVLNGAFFVRGDKMATKSLERLIDEFNKLPGIGRKSATRLAFHILDISEEQVEKFVEAMREVKKSIKRCPVSVSYTHLL